MITSRGSMRNVRLASFLGASAEVLLYFVLVGLGPSIAGLGYLLVRGPGPRRRGRGRRPCPRLASACGNRPRGRHRIFCHGLDSGQRRPGRGDGFPRLPVVCPGTAAGAWTRPHPDQPAVCPGPRRKPRLYAHLPGPAQSAPGWPGSGHPAPPSRIRRRGRLAFRVEQRPWRTFRPAGERRDVSGAPPADRSRPAYLVRGSLRARRGSGRDPGPCP